MGSNLPHTDEKSSNQGDQRYLKVRRMEIQDSLHFSYFSEFCKEVCDVKTKNWSVWNKKFKNICWKLIGVKDNLQVNVARNLLN